jgi:UDPglucose 6-dehydrogenase
MALLSAGSSAGYDPGLLRAAVASNEYRYHRIAEKVRKTVGGALYKKRIGLLGLTFKSGTPDLRNSPAIEVAKLLAADDAQVAGYDPAVRGYLDSITVTDDAYEAVRDAEVVVLLTDWPEFQALDWSHVSQLMAGAAILDTRNVLDTRDLRRFGLRCTGIGRSAEFYQDD